LADTKTVHVQAIPMANLNLIRELEMAVSFGEPNRRNAVLAYATDLLIEGRYDEDDIWMFGEVVGLLANEIETTARAQLSNRLAPCGHAPANIIDRLACDDSIDVARPVLRHSDRVSDAALLRVASTKSQDHLLAIAQRRALHQDVTDVLVDRGNRDVVHAVAKNDGARFSESGFWKLVHRSENDIVLTLEVGARKDIPRHAFQKLIAKASDEVKARLAAVNPQAESDIRQAVSDVTGSMQAKFGPATRNYFAAKKEIGQMHRAGELGEQELADFARQRKFEETTVALALLCDLPVDVAERALCDDRGEMVLILAKAMKLAWTTARLLLLLRSADGMSAHDLETAQENYKQLNVNTARHVTTFYRSRREQKAAASAPTAGLPHLRRV
jgi:uncharacterized protein (DUF2336 family)